MSAAGHTYGQEERAGVRVERAIDAQRHEIRANLLEQLEKRIDLPAWVIAQGFHLSPVQKDPQKMAFADRHGEVLFLTKDLDANRWTYQTDGEPIQRGTLIDLMARRDALSPDECVNRMGACLDPSKRTGEPAAYREALADRDNTLRHAVARHLATMTSEKAAERDLEHLGVVRGSYDSWRFGPASLVLKNPDDLAHSRFRPGDRQMVFVERPIDAVAYERTHGKQHATYVYTGDHPTAEVKRKIGHIIASAPPELTIVAAFSRSSRGTALAEEIAELAGQRPSERRTPDFGSRWADQMQIEQRHRESLARLHRRPDPVLESARQAMAKALDAGVDQSAIRTAIVRRPPRGRQGIER
ncbi:MAG TPA: hypothetical protein VHO06_22800 [Polyangia bacterium]|nr:hypothetical protein [Polyangia bacterium]